MSHRRHIEVQQKPRRTIGEFQIRNDLRQVNRVNAFNRLEFDDHYPFDDEVKSKAAVDRNALVRELDRRSCSKHSCACVISMISYSR